jgi:hypothetical protein
VGTPDRRFTPPWHIEDNGACFIVPDNNGQALRYVYYENEPGQHTAAGLLTRDDARRIACSPQHTDSARRTSRCWPRSESGKLAAQHIEGPLVNMDSEISSGPTTPPISCSAAANRMRAHRDRRRKGLRCIRIELRETEVDVLIRKGLLRPDARNDLNAVVHALYDHLDATLSA